MLCSKWHYALQVYDSQLWSTLEQVLLKPLCQHIESDLRLHHHAALLTGVPPLTPSSGGLLDVTQLLQVPPLQLSTRLVDIRCMLPASFPANHWEDIAAVTVWHMRSALLAG